jgi:subtilase family serine protease
MLRLSSVVAGLTLAAASTIPLIAGASAGATIATVPHFAGVRDLGRAAATTRVTVALTLRYRNDGQLDQLIEAQSDPDSPQFAHFLSNDEFNAFFAPDMRDYAHVIGALQRAGFTVHTYSNRTLVDATAGARTVERYFGTEIHTVSQTGYGIRYANAVPATLPRELAGIVDTATGFDTIMKARYLYQFGARGFHPGVIGGNLMGPDGGYGPLATAQGYDFPVQHGKDGTGRTVANVAGDVINTDISTFLKYFKVKQTGKITRTQIQAPSSGANVEATLDVETIGGLAPGANIHLYILQDPVDQTGEDAYNTIVSDNSVDAVNSSFGVCENSDQSYATAALKIIRQGEAKGISWSASTGDGGANECDGPQLVPAVLPAVSGIGGTHLIVDSKGNYTSESAWNGGGGGPSQLYKKPKYQHGITGMTSKTKRNLPDIAFVADVQDSYYFEGAWSGPIGGTSWASPISIALRAEINQIKGKRSGFVNPLIYSVFKKTQYQGFHDVTTGSNGFPATTGYDNATGIGSLDGFIYSGLEK